MNEVTLCIGSNVKTDENMLFCRQLLQEISNEIFYSKTIETKPYGEAFYINNFLNQLAFFRTELSESDLNIKLKEIELLMGRNASHKKLGIVVIDIDLIKLNDDILKPDDWSRNYVYDLLPSLCESLSKMK